MVMRLLQIGEVCRKPASGVAPARHTEWIDMAKKISAKARAAARKQRDKWKTKRWYTIRAPRHPWDFKRIGETIGESDEHIIGRVYEMTQQEFDGNFSKMHVVMRFRVTECVGQDALTTFIGHHHQTDHTRRQIRRYRGKVDDVVDVVTTDGYLVRMKPLIITQQRVQTSVKQDMRTRTREIIIAFAAKNTYAGVQNALLDGKLEEEIEKAVKSIYPVRSVAIRKSQLLQEGVVASDGMTLDEVHAQEERQAAEVKAKKAAALAAAMAEEAGESVEEDEEEDDQPEAAEEAPAEEAAAEPAEEAPAAAEDASTPDYASMTVAELKELLKAAGKPVSGKKADLIARLNE
ncbi:MAG TPA: 30S ribosomal protein S3ae [Candidatus Poseidoniales archaeon]|nr:MAG TPA: 30S ribosomal protein S3ae [Candidatus Poseidoniales archaeon]